MIRIQKSLTQVLQKNGLSNSNTSSHYSNCRICFTFSKHLVHAEIFSLNFLVYHYTLTSTFYLLFTSYIQLKNKKDKICTVLNYKISKIGSLIWNAYSVKISHVSYFITH